MLNSHHFLKIILLLLLLPITVQADDVSDFWCNDIGSVTNTTCTVISKNDTEAQAAAKLEKALSAGFDDIASDPTLTPQLIAITPTQGTQGETIAISITGINFQNADQLGFSNGIEIIGTPIITSTTQINATVKIAADAQAGTTNVSVQSNTETATLGNAFTILAIVTTPQVVVDSGEGNPLTPTPIVTPGIIQFSQTEYNINENSGSHHTFNVERSGGSDGTSDNDDPDLQPTTIDEPDSQPTTTGGASNVTTGPEDTTDASTGETTIPANAYEPIIPPKESIKSGKNPPTVPTQAEETKTMLQEVGTPTTTNEQNTSANISIPSSPVYAPSCSTTGNINTSCNAGDRIITDVVIAENISVSHAVFDGTVENHGRISGSTFTSDAKLIGGILNGYITNEGILKDFEFVGRSIIGGILAGKITNASKVGGYFQDVTLAADTHIIGGRLRGNISGDIQYPTRLEALKILAGSHLENVIISEDVELSEDITCGPGVEFADPTQNICPNHEEVEAKIIAPPLLNLGDAVAINKQGEFIPTQATFAGNASINDDGLVDIHGSITVDANDVAKLADILVVIYSVTQSRYYMLGSNGETTIWDMDISSLIPFTQEITLDTVQTVQISSVFLDTNGMLNVYFGYRLEDGTIVYNSETIVVEIE